MKKTEQIVKNSRRKFLRNAGLGIAGLTILPKINDANATSLPNDGEGLLGNGTQSIDEHIDHFMFGKSANPYLPNQLEDLSLKQYAEIFDEGEYVLQNDHISRSISWQKVVSRLK